LKELVYIILCVSLFSCKQKVGGQLILHAENKQLSTQNGVLYYYDTPFSGTLKVFDEVNQTKNAANYSNGKKEGEEKKWFVNDSVAEIRFYKEGLKVGIHKSWWKNGQQKFEYPYNNNGVYHGAFKEWYASGQLVREFHYHNGREKGTQKMWLANGNIRANYTVIDNERFGLIGLKKCYSVKTKDEK